MINFSRDDQCYKSLKKVGQRGVGINVIMINYVSDIALRSICLKLRVSLTVFTLSRVVWRSLGITALSMKRKKCLKSLFEFAAFCSKY
ncbi:hypothetical protein A2U01_0002053 [Trifolium medium]|uniref:Uncharacterized protein n=1 Tax=Trifolium medium TaxID=97028 RepID=A0A392M2Q1_9FABA|nr:hypothetical protein [Trifolium medium]